MVMTRERERPVFSAVLPEGLVEIVYREDPPETAFLISRAGHEEVSARLDGSGGSLSPYSPENNLLTHKVVLLPSSTADYGSSAELLAELRSFIHRYVDVSEVFEEISAAYVLFSWVYDAFGELPYLRVRGDYGSGKSRYLLTVGSLCYKPIFASGASTVSPLFRIIDAVRGTLVVDEGDFRVSDEKAEIVKILNNGNARGFPVLRSEVSASKEINPRAFVVYGPKVIATRKHFEDAALESRCLTEEMGGRPLRGDIPLNLPESFHEEALSLRNKLLRFRFDHFHRLGEVLPVLEPSVEPRIRQIFAPLLSTVESSSTRARLAELARSYSEAVSLDRSLSVEAQLLSVIADLRSSCDVIAVGDIAREFARRHGADFDRSVTPRWIGSLLRRRLFLTPVRRNGSFVLSMDDSCTLDHLMAKYGITSEGDIRDVGDIAGSSS